MDYQNKQTPEWAAPRDAIGRRLIPGPAAHVMEEGHKRAPGSFQYLKRKSDMVIKMENSPQRVSLIFELIFIGIKFFHLVVE